MVTRHEPKKDRMLREISRNKSITLSTNVPHKVSGIGFARVGFASIPSVCCTVQLNNAYGHMGIVHMVARQAMFQLAEEEGLPIAALSLDVHTGILSRKKKFLDQDGKHRVGNVVRCNIEVHRDFADQYESKMPKCWEY